MRSLAMNYLTVVIVICCSFTLTIHAKGFESYTPFEIPRSQVIEVKDSHIQRSYPLFIKLPKSYRKSPQKHYPVIYLTDAWYSFQIVSGATRYPMNSGKMAEAIIVGISYEKGSRGDLSRVYDYTPVKSSLWRKDTGGADQFIRFIETDVFSYIENNYRTNPDNRIFVGNSLGGLLGSYILLTKPELFRHYILGSPSYWFHNKTIFALAPPLLAKNQNVKANVFIAIGERETKALESQYTMVEDAQAFSKLLANWQKKTDNSNVKQRLFIIPHANHETAFPTTVTQGLYWVLSKNK
ncbi:alpha/beta hydrolase [Colwellia sp. RSH04]|uniref:alpha/beta hydrolase n=1 Tax=Colwellia sp. RSH04 TaxID=2305464 RepID=UPI0021753F40|nr:alpha/beta hydrolase-fold protein [Colwellia sp. RSH04]